MTPNSMRTFAHKLRSTEAAEIAEAALVMPVVFLFLLGIIWFGRAFNIYSTITQAAQQGVVIAARPTCATCAAPAQGWGGNPPYWGTSFSGNQAVFTAISSVLQASSLDPSQIISNSGTVGSGCTSYSNVLVCREVLLNLPSNSQPPTQACSTPTSEAQICGAQVSFQFPFQFYLPFTSLNLTQVILNAQAQSRMEN